MLNNVIEHPVFNKIICLFKIYALFLQPENDKIGQKA